MNNCTLKKQTGIAYLPKFARKIRCQRQGWWSVPRFRAFELQLPVMFEVWYSLILIRMTELNMDIMEHVDSSMRYMHNSWLTILIAVNILIFIGIKFQMMAPKSTILTRFIQHTIYTSISMLTSTPSTNYTLNEHEALCQYGPYAIPRAIMPQCMFGEIIWYTDFFWSASEQTGE